MQNIAIITDTNSSIPFDLASKYYTVQVPITINFGEESYKAVYALNDADTFCRIDREGELPTSAVAASQSFPGHRHIEKMCILHVNAPQMTREFENEIRSRMQCPSEFLFVKVTPGLSVHSGAGMVGTDIVVK